MKVYYSCEPNTPEEIITHALSNALYIMEPKVRAAASMPEIKDVYTVGASMFIHLCNGDLFSVAVQRMTPALDDEI